MNIEDIIDLEWSLFTNVQNIGDRAECQDNNQMFHTMRMSQLKTWSETLLTSYHMDLQLAILNHRNVMTEKYARMMKYTDPTNYLTFKDQLPVLAKEVPEMIQDIVSHYLLWVEEVRQDYPEIINRGRPIYTTQDERDDVSLQTYLTCELETYSLETLKIYQDYVHQEKSQNHNLYKATLEYTAHDMGYSSLDDIH